MVLASRPVLSDSRLAARPVGAKQRFNTFRLEDRQDGADDGGLADPRTAGDDEILEAKCSAHGLLLTLGQRHIQLALHPVGAPSGGSIAGHGG